MLEANDAYLQIPLNIFLDRRLKADDIVLLTSFFFLKNKEDKKEEDSVLEFRVDFLLNRLGITRNQFEFTLKRLENFSWISDVRDKAGGYKEIRINIPELSQEVYEQPGSRIARSWNKYFGNRMIKYEDVQELKKFVLDGMEEELVLKVMEFSGLRAEGSPFHYAKAVLMDLYSRGVLTVSDFDKHERKGGSDNGQHVSKTYRGKEKGVTGKSGKEYREDDYR
ncbi:MAG: DnaD domain protein [Halanaerobiaceae bacterium]|nr:DnaD domain protein [Halanaerobiaceae bacterium]